MNAALGNNVTEVSTEVEQFIDSHAKGLMPDEREDLRQDILVALIEGFGPALRIYDPMWVNLMALAVLDHFRTERRLRNAPLTWAPLDLEERVPDVTAPDLDITLDLRKALDCLPSGLHNVALDLFFYDLSQQEVAAKYKRNQSWVSAAKKQIVQKVYSFLKENKPCQ